MAVVVKVDNSIQSTPAADGWHDAVVAEVLALEPVKHPKYGLQHQGILMIQLDEEYGGEGEWANKRKEVRVYFDLRRGLGSSKKGTKLRTRLEEWRGSEFTKIELEKFEKDGIDLEALVNRPVRVLTASEKAKTSDNQYSKVVKFAPPGEVKLKVRDYTPYAERDEKGGEHPESGSGDHSASSGGEADDEKLPF